MRRRLAVLAIAVVAALAGSTGAFAHGSDEGSTEVGPADWTIPAGQCSLLPSGTELTGRGQIRTTTEFSVDPDGTAHVSVRSVASGTATDNQGGRYWWTYANTFKGSQPGPATVTDHFVLLGFGKARLFSAFKWKLTYGPASDPMNPFADGDVTGFEELYSIGDPEHCDPI